MWCSCISHYFSKNDLCLPFPQRFQKKFPHESKLCKFLVLHLSCDCVTFNFMTDDFMSRLTPCPWIKVSSANITNQIYFEMLRKKNIFQNVEKEQSISKCWERSVKRKPNLNFSRVKKIVFWSTLGYSRKNPNREGGGGRVWGHRISRGTEERSCGNSGVN